MRLTSAVENLVDACGRVSADERQVEKDRLNRNEMLPVSTDDVCGIP